MKKISWHWLTLAMLSLCLFGWFLWTLAWQIGFGLPGYANFYLHQNKYEAIIATVKALPLAPGAKISKRVNGFEVVAERNRSGSYAMTITTADLGHAGIYGYVYSDTPLTVHPNDNYPDLPSVDNPGGMPFVDKQIVGQGGRWWSVYNNLL